MTDASSYDASAQGGQGSPAQSPSMNLSGLAAYTHGILSTTFGQAIAVLIVIIAAVWLLKYLGEELT